MKKNVPARPRCLAENYVRNPFTSRKIDQSISYSSRFQLNHMCSQFLGKTDILLQRGVIGGLNAAQFFTGRYDVDRVPVVRQAAGHARAYSQQLLSAPPRGYR